MSPRRDLRPERSVRNMNSDRRATRPNQARTTLLLVLMVSFLFGLIVLPRLDPGAEALIGQPATDFALPVIHGGDAGSRIRLSDLRGQVVVLDFWASWCKPCLQGFPILKRAAMALGRRAMFVGINTGDDPASAQAVLGRLDPPYPCVEDSDGSVATMYDVDNLPTLVVVDAEGTVRSVRTGVATPEEIDKLIASAAQ